MRNKTISKTIIAIAILLGAMPIYAQKIKVKKQVVYVDDTATYKSYRTKGSALSTAQDRVITTMNDDTLVWVKHEELTMPKTSYEKGNSVYEYYWVLSFAGTDFTMKYKGNITRFDEEFVKSAVLKDNKLNMNALAEYEKKQIRDIEPVINLQKAIENRQKLAERPDYAEYVKQLSERFAMNKLTVGIGGIYFQNSTGKSPEHIGTFEKKVAKLGTEYNVYRKTNKAFIASIFHETQSGRVFIRTGLDNVGKEYYITGPADNAMLLTAFQYLVDYGYL